jgi:hypothetical protein
LWFCAALLIFCGGYALYRRWTRKKEKSVVKAFPANGAIFGGVVLIAVATFLVRFPYPNGSSFYNMQLGYFPGYIVFFIAGTLAYRQSWLTTLSRKTGLFWGRVGLIGGLVLWISLLVLGGAFKGQSSSYSGGPHWQSLGLCFWEAIAGVGLSLYFLVLFREKFNRQGKWSRFFSDNAFAVYVFHPPILIAISLSMAGLHWDPLLKFLLLTFLSIVVSFSISAFVLRKIPVLNKIL